MFCLSFLLIIFIYIIDIWWFSHYFIFIKILNLAAFIVIIILMIILLTIDPGIIPPNIIIVNEKYNKKFKNLFFNIDFKRKLTNIIKIKNNNISYCNICKIYKSDRISHCSKCNFCFLEFDHHCPWLDICISKKNYPVFIWLISIIQIYCILNIIDRIYTAYYFKNIKSLIVLLIWILFFIVIFILLNFLYIYHIYFLIKNISTKIYWLKLHINFDYRIINKLLFDYFYPSLIINFFNSISKYNNIFSNNYKILKNKNSIINLKTDK